MSKTSHFHTVNAWSLKTFLISAKEGCWAVYNQRFCEKSKDSRTLYESKCVWRESKFLSGHKCAASKWVDCFDNPDKSVDYDINGFYNSPTGCWSINNKNDCINSADSRPGYKSKCCWKESRFLSGNKCEPLKWITCFDTISGCMCK